MAEQINHIVYKTTNLINGKIYIGVHSTNNINDSYLGSGRIFVKALRKYGMSNFKREILFNVSTIIEALKIEARLVNDKFILSPSNYNCTVGGRGANGKSNKGRKHTKEAIKKIIKAGKRPCSVETKNKISIANTGKKHSKEIVDKNRELRLLYFETNNSPRKGAKLTDVQKRKMSIIKTGTKHSDETKRKMSESHKGKTYKGKKVIDNITGVVYKSVSDACRKLDLSSRTVWRNLKKEGYNLSYL